MSKRSLRGQRKKSDKAHAHNEIREERIRKWNAYLDHPQGLNLSGIPLPALREHIERYIKQGHKIRRASKK